VDHYKVELVISAATVVTAKADQKFDVKLTAQDSGNATLTCLNNRVKNVTWTMNSSAGLLIAERDPEPLVRLLRQRLTFVSGVVTTTSTDAYLQ